MIGGSFQSPSSNKSELEEGAAFTRRFDVDGLIPALITDAEGGSVLMFAYMNAEALRLTIETREAHFWSRSRKSHWRKGETSGNRLLVQDLLTDCDQDVIWVKAKLSGKAACHTGRPSCFYRRIRADGRARS
ncbi:MAG TPA: phosphoribosyl-AMP cyclohydrolase [Geobacterales bacterium]|nr:phosphoribosyl-AMP cyclohydrolase [Geobacterales bacterium]